jgi:phosphoesterase RecJ-like protein
MKDILAASDAKRIMIDHHPAPRLAVDFIFSRPEASSTSELVYEFISLLGQLERLTPLIAQCIYTGIMTDTGCFSYSSSNPRTFEIVAHLLKFSIPKDKIYSKVYDSFSESRMRLLGFCLSEKMKVFPEYHTAFISLSLEEQEKYNFSIGDSEGFVNYPLSIKDIKFTALFTERKDKVKISFRSRGSFAANAFAEKNFSGGGHLNAAGGESTLTLNETIEKFLNILPEYAPELKNHEK